MQQEEWLEDRLGKNAKIAGWLVFLMGVFICAACNAQEEPTEGAAASAENQLTEAPDLPESTVDQLRALGYTGFTDTQVEPGEKAVRVLDASRIAPG